MADRDDDFLARWSRRKAEARRGLHRKEEDADAAPEPPAEAEQAGEKAGAEESGPVREARADPAAAPAGESAQARGEGDAGEFEDFDFDSLDYDSDYTRFMQKDVPEAVRRRALRMLWKSDPILANVDGLNDYDEDFTDAAMAVKGALKTAYKAGHGYASDEEVKEREERRLAEREAKARDAVGAQDAEASEAAGNAESARAGEDGAAQGAEGDNDAGAGAAVAEADPGGDAAPEADEEGSGSTERHDKT